MQMPNLGNTTVPVNPSRTSTSYTAEEPQKKSKAKGIALAIAAVVVIIAIAAVVMNFMGGENPEESANTPIPDVTGKTIEVATTELEDAGFEIGNVEEATNNTVEEGKVVSQDPKWSVQAMLNVPRTCNVVPRLPYAPYVSITAESDFGRYTATSA